MFPQLESLPTFLADNTVAMTILALTITNTIQIAKLCQWKKDKFKDK